MGDLVDLDAFRKQREEEEEAKAKAEAESKAAEEEAELEQLQYLLDSIISSLGALTGAYVTYDDWRDPNYFNGYNNYSVYTHEAGYNDDGYYEKSWELNPFEVEDDEEEDF